ncbi:MAG: hypothetical protein HKO62_14145 [Gammaproteobacteria bacterium]|nr:hypothetical protein [Gammaproteobacteria bacterium]
MADTAGTQLHVTATVTQPCSTSLSAAASRLRPVSAQGGLAVSCSPGKAYAVDISPARVLAAAPGAGRQRYQVTPSGRPLALDVSPGTGTTQRYRLESPTQARQPAIVTVTF